jgi:hypothetical protein
MKSNNVKVMSNGSAIPNLIKPLRLAGLLRSRLCHETRREIKYVAFLVCNKATLAQTWPFELPERQY